MTFEEVLAVLLGWLGLDVGVGTHGANGAPPVTALEAEGRLSRGEGFGEESALPASVVFVLDDGEGAQIATFRLYENSYAGGGWYDDEEEVLEIRSGVIQLLIAPAVEQSRRGANAR
jgi:hypothetical protein